MPNPKTIEELLKMDACPFKDGQEISYNKVKTLAYLMEVNLFEYCIDFFILYDEHEMLPFKMPDGYYHLPPDKQLGLPLGEYYSNDLHSIVDILPLGILRQYFGKTGIAVNYYSGALEANDFTGYKRTINILKQPPNLYNPLDHKEEVLMPNNSANEKQPAKKTVTMALPWQEMSTYESSGWLGGVFAWDSRHKGVDQYADKGDMVDTYAYRYGCLTHWLPFTPPKTPTVEAPVEPETIVYMYDAVIANELWYYKDFGALEHIVKQGENWDRDQWFEISYRIEQGLFITATTPTAWLASQAEQEG